MFAIDQILLVGDGIIVLVKEGNDICESDLDYDVADYGVRIITEKGDIPLTEDVLDHILQAEDTLVHVYEVSSHQILGQYCGNLVMDRDELLKAKGGWEYLFVRGVVGG